MMYYRIEIRLHLLLSLFTVLVINSGCHKNENFCIDENQLLDFEVREQVGDTSLVTDTVYANTRITFKPETLADSISWQIGNSPTRVYEKEVSLIFTDTGAIDINFSGNQLNACNKVLRVQKTKSLVILNNGPANISPLVGMYKGIIKGEQDSFTVEIKYWFGTRYTWWKHGAYSIHNFPKGYKDSTQNFNGYSRPEIDGIICSTGYKNFQVDKTGNIPAQGINGYGSLSVTDKNTLIINYKKINIKKLEQTGEIEYLNEQFMGKRNF